MGADRYNKCPKCIRLHNEDVEALGEPNVKMSIE